MRLKPALSTFYSRNEVKKHLEEKDVENAWKVSRFFAFFYDTFVVHLQYLKEIKSCSGVLLLTRVCSFVCLICSSFGCLITKHLMSPYVSGNIEKPNSRISGTKSNGTERFWKLISKILDNLQRLSFFPEIWKFREFSVPLGLITPFGPLQDLKDGGGLYFYQLYVCFLVLRDRIISMTHFHVSYAMTRFVQFLRRRFLILSSAMSRINRINENKSYSGRTDRYFERSK